MLFIDPDKNYPRHIGDLKLANPDWEEGQDFPENWKQVQYAKEMPKRADDEIIYESEPEEVDGVLTQTFKVRKMTPEELELKLPANRLRAKLIAAGFTEAEIKALAG